mgnify:CR=1 FL=1
MKVIFKCFWGLTKYKKSSTPVNLWLIKNSVELKKCSKQHIHPPNLTCKSWGWWSLLHQKLYPGQQRIDRFDLTIHFMSYSLPKNLGIIHWMSGVWLTSWTGAEWVTDPACRTTEDNKLFFEYICVPHVELWFIFELIKQELDLAFIMVKLWSQCLWLWSLRAFFYSVTHKTFL